MAAPIASILSVDGNFELALCPDSIELRLSPTAAKQLNEAFETAKAAGGLPILKQIKSILVEMAHDACQHFAARMESVPLEEVTQVVYRNGVLEVRTAGGNQIRRAWTMGIESCQFEYKGEVPGVFAEKDAVEFVRRVEEVKPLHAEYLRQVRRVVR